MRISGTVDIGPIDQMDDTRVEHIKDFKGGFL